MGRKRQPPKVRVGEIYGRLTVTGLEYTGGYHKAICECSCGNIRTIRQACLIDGESKSCGCLAAEQASDRAKTHGLSTHRLYGVWNCMNRRCYNETRKDYKHYGGRGIKVCEDWRFDNPKGFHNFLEDMEPSFIEGLEIDRIDNDGNYIKSNCKWSTRSEQVVNRRFIEGMIGRPRMLHDGNEALHLAAMANKYNINPTMLHDRISKLGMSLEEALTLPVKTKRYFLIFDGREHSISDVFVTPPNFLALVKKCGVTTEDFIYYLFGDNVLVEGLVNKARITFDKRAIDLSSFTFKLPRVLDGFKRYLSNEYHHKEYRYAG